MKRSFSNISVALSKQGSNGALVQPDFDALDIHTAWKPSEFSLVESVDLTAAILSAEKPKDSQMMGQYLNDQLGHFPEGYDFMGGKSKVLKLADSFKFAGGSADVEPGCNFAKLAEDARELWEELKPHGDDSNRQNGSCCTSMCSTLASATSTVASSTFSLEFAESSPVHEGTAPSFGFDSSTTWARRPTLPAYPHRNSTKLRLPATSAAAPTPAAADAALEAVATDAVVTAACRLLLNAIEHRDAAAAAAANYTAAAGRIVSPVGLEPFSLGPGRPRA
jgi:hypothetical protein